MKRLFWAASFAVFANMAAAATPLSAQEAAPIETPASILETPDDEFYVYNSDMRTAYLIALESALNEGETETARRALLRIASLEETQAQRAFLLDMPRFNWRLERDERTLRDRTFSRFAFETLKGRSIAQLPAFLEITNRVYRDPDCDDACKSDVSQAGILAMGGVPASRPSEEAYQTALYLRVRALFNEGRFEEAQTLIPLFDEGDYGQREVDGIVEIAIGKMIAKAEIALSEGRRKEAEREFALIRSLPTDIDKSGPLGDISSEVFTQKQTGDPLRALAFARLSYEQLRETPYGRDPEFLSLLTALSDLCAAVGDLECLRGATSDAIALINSAGDSRLSFEARQALEWRARYLVIEDRKDEALALLEKVQGTRLRPGTVTYARALTDLGNLPDTPPAFNRPILEAALAQLDERVSKKDSNDRWFLLMALGAGLQNGGAFAGAEAAYRQAYAIALEYFEPQAMGTMDAAESLANTLILQDRWDEAKPLFQRNWEIALSYDDWSYDLGSEFGGWMRVLINEGRLDEADKISEEVWAAVANNDDVGLRDRSLYASVRAFVLFQQGRFAESEEVSKVASAGDVDPILAGNIAEAIERQGRFADAQEYREKALEVSKTNILTGAFSEERIEAGVDLAANLAAQGKGNEAQILFADTLDLAQRRNDPLKFGPARVAPRYARFLLSEGEAREASDLANIALEASATRLARLAPGVGETAYLAAVAEQREAAVLRIESLLTAGIDDAATFGDLFDAAQRAEISPAASALSLNSAQSLATAVGAGDVVESWRKAQRDLADIDRQFSALVGGGAVSDRLRAQLIADREARLANLQRIESELESRFPRFFDLARPSPASLDSVRSVLEDDEALVLLVAAGDYAVADPFGGMVMVVTREGQAAAPIALSTAAMRSLASELHDGLAKPGSGETYSPDYDYPTVFYSRDKAFELYNALFAAPAIEALITDKPRWTIVPQGALISVSYEALVTREPEGDVEGDVDPEILRTTGWLGMERALSIAPSVSSVALARTGDASISAPNTQTFVGVGDPAFRGLPDPEVEMPADLRARGVLAATRAPGASRNYYRGQTANLAALAGLERLKGTQIELQTLAAVLEAPQTTLLTQLDATEQRVSELSTSGELARAGLVVFATHGLIAGDSGLELSEPALALTPPAGVEQAALTPDNDGLLSASEAAALKLAADWLILSACNTAAGSGDEAEGLTGLARGFLFAGAKALLVSHFPVSDRAMPLLTSTAVTLRSQDGLDRAQAMLEARRRMMADTRDDAGGYSLAHPKAWAALTLISPE